MGELQPHRLEEHQTCQRERKFFNSSIHLSSLYPGSEDVVVGAAWTVVRRTSKPSQVAGAVTKASVWAAVAGFNDPIR
jgi:hypothetical protein